MPAPTDEQIKELGPEISPFERNPEGLRSIIDGEGIVFTEHIYDATKNGKPPNLILVNPYEIENNPPYGRYLWVINKEGLWLILEATPNPESKIRGCVCHTNITGGAKALHGGELWFGEDDTIYYNFKSGRYGHPTNDQAIAIFEYLKCVYKTIQPMSI